MSIIRNTVNDARFMVHWMDDDGFERWAIGHDFRYWRDGVNDIQTPCCELRGVHTGDTEGSAADHSECLTIEGGKVTLYLVTQSGCHELSEYDLKSGHVR